MEQRFKSLSVFDFQKRFDTKEKCLDYLVELKWSNGQGKRF